ncbi:hypothetical protein Pelo_14681 [Pelomyxa schiedti]|nr:hypothetical protein Pelo_14681 [Pelomyxa schiedti]
MHGFTEVRKHRHDNERTLRRGDGGPRRGTSVPSETDYGLLGQLLNLRAENEAMRNKSAAIDAHLENLERSLEHMSSARGTARFDFSKSISRNAETPVSEVPTENQLADYCSSLSLPATYRSNVSSQSNLRSLSQPVTPKRTPVQFSNRQSLSGRDIGLYTGLTKVFGTINRSNCGSEYRTAVTAPKILLYSKGEGLKEGFYYVCNVDGAASFIGTTMKGSVAPETQLLLNSGILPNHLSGTQNQAATAKLTSSPTSARNRPLTYSQTRSSLLRSQKLTAHMKNESTFSPRPSALTPEERTKYFERLSAPRHQTPHTNTTASKHVTMQSLRQQYSANSNSHTTGSLASSAEQQDSNSVQEEGISQQQESEESLECSDPLEETSTRCEEPVPSE